MNRIDSPPLSHEGEGGTLFLHSETLPQLPGVRFFFTTRRGGESSEGWRSLILGAAVGDDPRRVRANRARVTEALGLVPEALRLPRQVHGRLTAVAGEEPWPLPPEADAVATDRPGVVAGVLTADCCPVLFADPEARVVGAAHAGWRGALDGVLESCLETMEGLGARRERIHGVIGPTIRQKAYQVDDEFMVRFLLTGFPASMKNELPNGAETGNFTLFAPDERQGRWRFDLPGYVHVRLRHAGLGESFIHDTHQCTHDLEQDFFSHRRSTSRGEGPCGRQMGGVFLLRADPAAGRAVGPRLE
ncbi:MAG: peptidoglycan editing factor PgeF [Magnetococcales bacterium]|nr:peptidoglycan editing factor PgeF [Magnetococcales bacterium]